MGPPKRACTTTRAGLKSFQSLEERDGLVRVKVVTFMGTAKHRGSIQASRPVAQGLFLGIHEKNYFNVAEVYDGTG